TLPRVDRCRRAPSAALPGAAPARVPSDQRVHPLRGGARSMTEGYGTPQNGNPTTTTTAGAPAPSDEQSLSVGRDGPIVLHDIYRLEKMAQFTRDRVPERVVHAEGAGAYGVFRTTNDASEYTCADGFQPGRETPMLARFSTVAGEQGSQDTWR